MPGVRVYAPISTVGVKKLKVSKEMSLKLTVQVSGRGCYFALKEIA